MIEKVNELIRKEDCILWVGAGLSIYAGYPSGKTLSEMIYKKFTSTQRKEIDVNLSLPNMAEEFLRINGTRNELIKMLKDEFKKRPSSTKYHQLIARIPHIQTIVTTNYDNLFEQVYQDKASVAIIENDLPYMDKVEIFKVHGDLQNPDSIIIAQRDYKNFFINDDKNSIYWSVIKGKIVNKAVVFVGYSYEDLNVQVVFDKIFDVLKDNRKPIFLIAPALPLSKVKYFHSLNIEYIDMGGEEFIEQLIEDIKENIRVDFDNKFISAETFQKFLSYDNLTAELIGTENGFNVKKIAALDGKDIKGTVSINFKDEQEGENFKDFLFGRKSKVFELNSENLLHMKFLSTSGINLMSYKEGDYSFILKRQAIRKGKFDIRFKDGFEVEEINYHIHIFDKKFEIILTYRNCEFTIEIERMIDFNNEAKLLFETKSPFEKVDHAINVYNLLKHVYEGGPFSIFTDEGKKKNDFDQRQNGKQPIDIDLYLSYFISLKRIENYFNIKFTMIEKVDKIDFADVAELLSYIDNKEIMKNNSGEYIITFIDNYAALDFVKKIHNKKNSPLLIETNKDAEFSIREHIVCLGFESFTIIDPIISNLNDIKKNKSVIAKLKSKSNKILMTFKDKFPDRDHDALIPLTY